MKLISSGVDRATVVSQTTTRFDAPKPVTYAFSSVDFALAFIRNMRSGGIDNPPRVTTRSNCCTSAGFESASGSNLLNSGSKTYGAPQTEPIVTSTDGIQNQNHQRVGDLRIIQNISIAISPAPAHNIPSSLPLSTSQLPHPCTDSP